MEASGFAEERRKGFGYKENKIVWKKSEGKKGKGKQRNERKGREGKAREKKEREGKGRKVKEKAGKESEGKARKVKDWVNLVTCHVYTFYKETRKVDTTTVLRLKWILLLLWD